MIRNRFRSASLLTLTALAAGCSAGAVDSSVREEPTAQGATTVASSLTSVAPQDQVQARWRRQMSKAPPTTEGCFEAVHPSTQWVAVPCATGGHQLPPRGQAAAHPGSPAENAYPGAVLAPSAAPAPSTSAEAPSTEFEGAVAGSGEIKPMTSGTLPSGTISWAEGSFPNSKGLTSESYNGTSNDFSLQLNTQGNFTNSTVAALCKSTQTPASCTGWVQFVYWGGAAEIWYNLIGTGNTCPSSSWSNQGGACYLRAPNTSSVPSQAISNLPNMTLTGIAGGATDAVIVTTGPGQLYAAVNASVLDLRPNWSYADFNVLGNGSYGTATFNAGTTLGVQLLTDSATGSTSAPTCGPYNSTTGEGNNLPFVSGSCCTFGGDVPGITFTESNATSPTGFACPTGFTSTVYMVANNGGKYQVWKYAGSGTSWTPITGANTSVAQIATTVSGLYMVGNNGGSNQVWQYSGSGSSWTPITGTNTIIKSVSGDQGGKNLYMLGSNSGNALVWQYDWAGSNWTALTGVNTSVLSLAETSGVPYMLANNGGAEQLWQYSGSGTSWTALTGTNTTISQVATTGGVSYMLATNGGAAQVWKYSGSGSSWTAITGTNTTVSSLQAAGGQVYMLAANGSGAKQVWQYSGSGSSWTATTGTNTSVSSITATGDHVYMVANNGGANQLWRYAGSGASWTALTGTNTQVAQVAETVLSN